MNKTELLKEYRRKNMDMPTRKLSRIIYNENPLLFKNVEYVRTQLIKLENPKSLYFKEEFKKEEKKKKVF